MKELLNKKVIGMDEKTAKELEKEFTPEQMKEFADGRGEDEDDGDK